MIAIDKFDIDISDTSILCYYNTNRMFSIWTDSIDGINDGEYILHIWNYWGTDRLVLPVIKYIDNDSIIDNNGIFNICKIIGIDEV